MAEIRLNNVSKVFGGGTTAVDDVSLRVEDGEFLVLVGPSGCGKTTLLRLIGGLEEATSGRIEIGARDVTEFSPRHRDVAMVFQNYALYPHMSVRENLGYGLKVRRVEKAARAERVAEVSRMLGLEELLERRPSELSGGQKQRVAIGRAVAREPSVFLMDEPLSNLDAKLRVAMRAELARLHERLSVTTVYVTHDQVEAMTLGQRVAVMRNGVIQQLDTPQRLYAEPVNLFVAAFIGSPSMNLLEATSDGERISLGQWEIPVTAHLPTGPMIVGVRPEYFESSDFAAPDLPRITVQATVVEDLGAELHVHFPVDAPRIDTEETRQAVEGESEALIADDARAIFTARVDARSSVTRRQALELAVDPSRFHFFNVDTGERLGATTRAAALTG
jgi:multiple sugar transport system ATP-binding protein